MTESIDEVISFLAQGVQIERAEFAIVRAAPCREHDIELFAAQSKPSDVHVVILASQAAVRITVVVHLGKRAVIVVYYVVPIPIGYSANVLVVPSLSDLYNTFFPFPPYYDIHIRAGRENLVDTIGGLLASNYSGNGRREGVH
jgi:hypothetical protein